jgi:serine/threonine protein phosphatase PrpC
VVAHPEIRQDKLTKQTTCLVVASDGLWDALTDQEAVDEVTKYTDAEQAAKELITLAYDRGSYDNISAIVAYLELPDSPETEDEDEHEHEEGTVEKSGSSVRPPRRTHDTTTTSKSLSTSGFFFS